ncbi:hypothetical protein ACROYT_G044326 [Oculina patagonica]
MTVDSGPWTKDHGLRIVDSGPWTKDRGLRTVDSGQWTKDWAAGLRTVDQGSWTHTTGQRIKDRTPRNKHCGKQAWDFQELTLLS